jgi:regulator of replication initiation timing
MTEETNKASGEDVLRWFDASETMFLAAHGADTAAEAKDMRTAVASLLSRNAELEAENDKFRDLLSDTWGNLERMANDELLGCQLVRLEAVQDRIRAALARTPAAGDQT